MSNISITSAVLVNFNQIKLVGKATYYSSPNQSYNTISIYRAGFGSFEGTTTVDANGDWTWTSSNLTNGLYSYVAGQVVNTIDYRSNTSLDVTISVASPVISSADTLNFNQIKLVGKATYYSSPNESYNTISIYRAGFGRLEGTTTVDANGNWTWTSNTLSNGDYSYFARQTVNTIDYQSSNSPTVNINVASPVISTVDITNINQIKLIGKATYYPSPNQSYNTISIYSQTGYPIDQTTVDANGNWTWTSNALNNGDYSYFAKQTVNTIDYQSSNSPTVNVNVASPVISTAMVTSTNQIYFTGTATYDSISSSNNTIQILNADVGTIYGSATVLANNTWSCTSTSVFTNIYYNFQCRQTINTIQYDSINFPFSINLAAPTILDATSSSNTSATVTFTSVSGASSYTATAISGDSSILAYSNGASPSITFTTLSPGTIYSITVVATNGTNVSSLSSSSTTVTTLLATPTNVVATSSSPTSATVTFSSVTGASSYTATATSGGSSILASSNTTTITFTTLSPVTTYSITVVAINGTVTSSPSTLITVTTLLAAPTNVVATSSSPTSATVTFFSVTGASSYIATATSGGSSILASSNTNTITFTTLSPATIYTITVVATNGTVTSSPSTPITVTTLLATPTNVVATSSSPTSATVTFSSVTGASSYTATATSGGSSILASSNGTSITFTTLSPGTTYTITVVATNGTNTSSPSTPPVSVTTTIPTTITSSFIVNGNQIYLSGIAYPTVLSILNSSDNTVVGTTNVNTDGTWSFLTDRLPNGTYSYKARETLNGINYTSDASPPLTIQINMDIFSNSTPTPIPRSTVNNLSIQSITPVTQNAISQRRTIHSVQYDGTIPGFEDTIGTWEVAQRLWNEILEFSTNNMDAYGRAYTTGDTTEIKLTANNLVEDLQTSVDQLAIRYPANAFRLFLQDNEYEFVTENIIIGATSNTINAPLGISPQKIAIVMQALKIINKDGGIYLAENYSQTVQPGGMTIEIAGGVYSLNPNNDPMLCLRLSISKLIII